MRSMGYKFVEVPINSVSYAESVMIKRGATVFIDQITTVGVYGNSAVEAMQFGVPLINHLNNVALSQSQSDELKNSPILDPGLGVDGLVSLLKNIFERKIDLEGISVKTKQFCDSFHGYVRTAKRWDEIYRGFANV
jgi:hypothetical protein